MTRDTFDLFDKPERGRFGDNESAPARVNGGASLHDFELALHAETHPGKQDDGAVFVSSDGKEARAVWIPKSLAEIERKGSTVPGEKKNGQKVQLQVVGVTIPEWIAKQKGLL